MMIFNSYLENIFLENVSDNRTNNFPIKKKQTKLNEKLNVIIRKFKKVNDNSKAIQ